MTLHVLICDDDETRVFKWRGLVEKHNVEAEVRTFTGQDLADFVSAVGWEELRARGGVRDPSDADRKALDAIAWADAIVIDSDLSPAPKDLNRIPSEHRDRVAGTLRNGYGDSIARQLRSYTDAGLLIVVNMFWSRHRLRRVFDLTLMQSARAYADVHVSEADLDEPFFWGSGGQPKDAFLPWQRPVVPEQLRVLSTSIASIVDLDAKVFATLGLDLTSFAPAQLDVFGEIDAADATFEQLTMSPMGFRYPSEARDKAACTRMAASVVRRWLDRVVVPGQNVVADAPHLVERFWQFMLPTLDDLNAWSASARMSWDAARTSPMAAALKETLEPFLARPVFDLEQARNAVRKLQPAKIVTPPDLGFAEDTSLFHSQDDLESYSSDVPGNSPRRWIAQLDEELDDIAYEPANRLLL